MKISPNYENTHWNNLNLDASYCEDWIKGADIVKDRIHGRYLAQIETLEKNLDPKILEFSGFLIMAVDCMVIETLNQFYLGIADTNEAYKGKNKESFRDFFKGSQFFNNYFDDDYSFCFYDHVRNGLLHQAQTKKRTLIRIGETEMVKKVANNIEVGIIIDRGKFHKALVDEFNCYIQKLKTDDTKYDGLRNKCIDKMKTIC